MLGSLSALVSRHIKDSQPFVCSKDCSTESFPVASSVLIVSLNPCTDYYSRVKGTFCGYWSSLIAAFFSPVLCPKNSLAALHLCTLNSVSTQGDHLTLQWPRNSPESKLEHSSHSSRWVPHSIPPFPPPPPAGFLQRSLSCTACFPMSEH